MATRLPLTDDGPIAPNLMHGTEGGEEAKEADILFSIQERCSK